METALDVLSRAASMVETNDIKAQESLYKGLAPPPPLPSAALERGPLPPRTPDDLDCDPRSSPGKELPSKMSKHERIKDWLEVSKPPKYEKEPPLHSRSTNGSSQMSVRSMSPSEGSERYIKCDASTPSDSYSLHHPGFLANHMRTPPPHPPPRYPHPRGELPSPSDGPLNLSLSHGADRGERSASIASPGSQARPSVITSVPDRRYEACSNGSTSPSHKDTDICDPAIEEHFRRSLGKHYPEYLARPHTGTPSPPPSLAPTHLLPPLPIVRSVSPQESVASTAVSETTTAKNVSVTGSVDDHFARALGDSTWLALKAKNDPQEASSPGSVDDHFAKALGDTWLKLKAEKEPARLPMAPATHSFPMTHAVPHSLSHPIPRAHSLPHPLPQRPSSSSPKSHTSSLVST